MRVIIVDDEEAALEAAREAVKKAIPDAEIAAFSRATQFLAFAEENPADIALLDINMKGMNGIETAKFLKSFCPKTNIIFATADPGYKAEAMDLHASGYIMKPVNAYKVSCELEELRYPPLEKIDKKIRLQCFGNFDVFDMSGIPVHFERSKAKELLAYLVTKNGARCTTRELSAVLFEDAEYTPQVRNHFQHIVTSMMKSLKKIGAEDVIERSYQNYAIIPARIDCDYYDYQRGGAAAKGLYKGEFMNQYSWAEYMSHSLHS